jgi:hypothetical protein
MRYRTKTGGTKNIDPLTYIDLWVYPPNKVLGKLYDDEAIPYGYIILVTFLNGEILTLPQCLRPSGEELEAGAND